MEILELHFQKLLGFGCEVLHTTNTKKIKNKYVNNPQ